MRRASHPSCATPSSVSSTITGARASTATMPPASASRISRTAITATTLEFERNIADDNRTVSARPEELAGLPQDYVAAHPPQADGQVRITMAYPDVFPVFRYAKSADLRKRLRTSFESRAYPANDAVLGRLFAQRAELASLLGYKNYAEYDLANRMAKSPARVQAFLDDIAAAARPTATADAARMLARLRKGRSFRSTPLAPGAPRMPPLSSARRTMRSIHSHSPVPALRQGRGRHPRADPGPVPGRDPAVADARLASRRQDVRDGGTRPGDRPLLPRHASTRRQVHPRPDVPGPYRHSGPGRARGDPGVQLSQRA